jgi:RecA-family ATPase
MIAICIATGRPFFGAPVMQGTVLGFFCEDDDKELMRRQKRICEAMGIRPEEVATRVKLQGRVGLDNMLVTYAGNEPKIGPFLAEIRQAVLEHRPRLLILDNIAQLFGGDENVRFQVANFCNHVAGLMVGMEGAVLLLGHPAKGETSEYSGSTAWDGSVRSRWFLRYADGDDKGSGRLVLEKAKANYAEASEIALRRINGLHVQDDEASWTPQQRAAIERRGDRAKDVVLRALAKLRDQKVKVSNSPHAGLYYAPKVILQKSLNEGVPKAEIQTALTDLIDKGRVVSVEIGKNEQRKPIMSLAPAGDRPAEKSAGDNSENDPSDPFEFPEAHPAAQPSPSHREGGLGCAPGSGLHGSLRGSLTSSATPAQNSGANPDADGDASADISDLLN